MRGVRFARILRQNQTPHERKLWSRLRNRRLDGIKFRRQHPIGPYIVDFYCASTQSIIELDGGGHIDQFKYDHARTEWLLENGYQVIRFTNAEVDQDIDVVLEKIILFCKGETNG